MMRSEKIWPFLTLIWPVLTSIYTLRLMSSPPCQRLSLHCGLLMLVLINQKLEMKIVTNYKIHLFVNISFQPTLHHLAGDMSHVVGVCRRFWCLHDRGRGLPLKTLWLKARHLHCHDGWYSSLKNQTVSGFGFVQSNHRENSFCISTWMRKYQDQLGNTRQPAKSAHTGHPYCLIEYCFTVVLKVDSRDSVGSFRGV